LKAIQVADEYIRKADSIIKSMDYALSGGATQVSPVDVDRVKKQVVDLLDKFIREKDVNSLKMALEIAKTLPEGCEVCIKYIEFAVDAANEGEIDEAVEWAKIVRRVVRVM